MSLPSEDSGEQVDEQYKVSGYATKEREREREREASGGGGRREVLTVDNVGLVGAHGGDCWAAGPKGWSEGPVPASTHNTAVRRPWWTFVTDSLFLAGRRRPLQPTRHTDSVPCCSGCCFCFRSRKTRPLLMLSERSVPATAVFKVLQQCSGSDSNGAIGRSAVKRRRLSSKNRTEMLKFSAPAMTVAAYGRTKLNSTKCNRSKSLYGQLRTPRGLRFKSTETATLIEDNNWTQQQ